MAGEVDLDTLLATLSVASRPQTYTLVSIDDTTETGPLTLGDDIGALITEAEGTSVVVTVAEAERRGWPVGFQAAWITIEVHSALEAVGLTAAMSRVLTERGISANVLAGFFHDHILVPVERADDAIEALRSLRDPSS